MIEDIIGIFETYDISMSCLSTSIGPVIVKYDLKFKDSEDIYKYKVKKDDIFYAISSLVKCPRIYISKSDLYESILIVEIPKKEPKYIFLKDCLKEIDLSKYEVPICLGKDCDMNIVTKDFVKMGGVLMSGATGTGKSVLINSFIYTILFSKTPDEIKFIMIDPKITELEFYDEIGHLLFPVIIDMDKALKALTWCVKEIERREKESTKKPYIVIVVDEFADVMLFGNGSDSKIEDIAKRGRDVGIFLLLSTSSPKESVFTKNLIDFIPVRIVGALATEEDSKRVIGEAGAEALLGNGDMIYKDMDTKEMIRVQTPYIESEEVDKLVKKLRTRECLCDNPLCAKCLLINCNDDDCKVHTQENKKKARQRVYYPGIKEMIESGTKITPKLMEERFYMGYKKGGDLLNEFWDDELEKYPYLYKRIEEEKKKNGTVNIQFIQKEFTMSPLHAMKLMKIIEKE